MTATPALSGPRRALAQALLAAAGTGVLAIPPLAVGLSGTASADALWTALRVAALLAFTLVFVNIVTGAFRPLFARVYKPRGVHRLHQVTGLTGFALAVAHGLMVFFFGAEGYSLTPVLVGPVALAVLAVAIAGALARRHLRSSWRWIHRLNYLIFAVVLAHGLNLGSDLGSNTLLMICFGVYAGVVFAAVLYRISGAVRQRGTRTR